MYIVGAYRWIRVARRRPCRARVDCPVIRSPSREQWCRQFHRRSPQPCTYCLHPDTPTIHQATWKKHYVDISTTFREADDAVFCTILSNRSHVLYTYLSERPEIAYSLRTTPWVKKKTRHQTLGHNFTNYYPIFKMFSLADLVVNLQQIRVLIFHHALNMSPHYLVKYECRKNGIILKYVLQLMMNHKVAKNLRFDELLYYTFIIQSAGERICKIGEHLAKLRAKSLTMSYAPFALQFCPQRCRSCQISWLTCVLQTETVIEHCYVNRQIDVS